MPKATDRNLFVIGDEELLFDPGKLLLSETIAMERATGLSWPQIIAGVNSGLMLATQAAVWVLRKRKNPKLNLKDVEWSVEDFSLLDPDWHPDYLILEPGEEPPTDDTEPEGVELSDEEDPKASLNPGSSSDSGSPQPIQDE